MVMEPQVFEYLEGDYTVLERDPLETLAKNNQLMAYKYNGFWQCMDTMRDKAYLDRLVEKGIAPWMKW
jgi:glucose-1-phosphate cytidylyltransferase